MIKIAENCTEKKNPLKTFLRYWVCYYQAVQYRIFSMLIFMHDLCNHGNKLRC